MQRDIYIKGNFSDWKKVSFAKAVSYLKGRLARASIKEGVKKTFDNHFKGVTYDELMKEINKEI